MPPRSDAPERDDALKPRPVQGAPGDPGAPAIPLQVIPGRKPLHPGITEDMIERLVRAFYGRVRQDPEIGPVFEAAIADWEPHLRTMMAFWSSVTLLSGRYKGQPVVKHLALGALTPRQFARWLELFGETAREVTPPEIAVLFIERAEAIAESLQRAISRAE